jgi:Zn-dependent protease/CBS domain-containing protein
MRGGFNIGRIFGIRINLDWSWIFIFLLVTVNLAVGVFPAWHPDWGPALAWGVAALASLLFFASVLVHELSHSLVARANGLPVRNITLFLFGGVSNIEREPASPKTEFLMAVVGPIASLLLGAIFLMLGGIRLGGENLVASPVRAMARLDPLSTLLLWLGPINLMVGLFNLVPAFPLDGGRILRSILWAATKNLRKATQWASGLGQLIAWLFIIGGVMMAFGVSLPLFGSGLASGLWLAFIGWFLNNAAINSRQRVLLQDLLEDVTVARLMRFDVVSVPPDMPVSSLVYDVMMNTDERSFPVMAEGRLIGMVCLQDIRKFPPAAWDQITVSRVMTPADQLAVTTPEENAGTALDKLTRRDVQQVPVVEEGRLVGLLRRRDILRWLQLQAELAA